MEITVTNKTGFSNYVSAPRVVNTYGNEKVNVCDTRRMWVEQSCCGRFSCS